MLEQYTVLVAVGGGVVLATLAIYAIERWLISAQYVHYKHTAPRIYAPAWRRYHVHYYIYALLFLAFDMEMAFMYPWAVVYVSLGLEAFADMMIFLGILLLGLVYAWSQKGLQRQ